MDLHVGGVTLTMDMDTVIANNTAGSSGNVISACVSQITAYGLEARLDPLYPIWHCTAQSMMKETALIQHQIVLQQMLVEQLLLLDLQLNMYCQPLIMRTHTLDHW